MATSSVVESSPTDTHRNLKDVFPSFSKDSLVVSNFLDESIWDNIDDEVAASWSASICATKNTQAALQELESLKSSRAALEVAAATFGKKGSVKGVSAVEKMAKWNGLLLGESSKELWFSIIRSYGLLGRLEHVERCFRSARKCKAWNRNDVRLSNIYLNALHTDIKKQFSAAEKLMKHEARATITTFNTLLKGCMHEPRNNTSYIRRVMHWIKEQGHTPDPVTYSSLIKSYSYGGDFEGVLSVRNIMSSNGFALTSTVWSDLLIACGAAQHPEIALMLWREAKTAFGGAAFVPTQVYNAMLTSCNATHQEERALNIFKEMKDAGVAPTVRTYNLAIRSCRGPSGQRLRKDQLDSAIELYKEMITLSIDPDAFTFGTIFELCAATKNGRLALDLYHDMQERKIKSNLVIMTAVLKSLARDNMIDECQEIFRKMVWGPARLKPRACTYSTLAREYREAGALTAALQAYEGMRRAGFAPNNRELQELMSAVADATLTNLGNAELQQAVASLFNVTSTKYIDLHGMSSQEARAAVLCILSMLMIEYQKTGFPPEPLTIITGRGRHSVDADGDLESKKEAVLPRIVRSLLSEELRILVNHNEESAKKLSMAEFNNPGRIVIPSETLLRWLRARGINERGQSRR